MTNRAIEFLSTEIEGNHPFFLLLDYIAPHIERDGTEFFKENITPPAALRHTDQVGTYTPKQSPSFDEEDVSDKPRVVQALPQGVSKKRSAESLLAVDDGIKEIIDVLEKTGVLENTYIFFISDNGVEGGAHRIWGNNGWPYEESIRVPFFIRGPGVEKGRTVDKLVANLAYTPTILDLAGVHSTKIFDGRSLRPLLEDKADGYISWRKDFLIESDPALQDYTGVRSEDYVYIEYDYDDNGISDEEEFYNFVADECVAKPDLYQLENQARNPCYQERIAQFRERLRDLKICVGKECW